MVMLDHIALKLLLNVYFTIHTLQTAQMMKLKQCLTNTIQNVLYRYSGLDTFYVHWKSVKKSDNIFLENKKYVLIPKWKNNPNFFRTANDPHLGRSFINPQFVQKLMNFGEVLLNEKANRKPNSGENLYLAALQLDQGKTRIQNLTRKFHILV